ncbi:MAG: hypothetical protein E2596_03240, partial [Pseudomonas sp.]|nr:hypothetical protein [Pseudomonas sp.]
MARYEISRGIGVIDVRAKPGHKTRGLLVAGNLVLECALGKGGISAFKREGDGATPLATMRLLWQVLKQVLEPSSATVLA